MGKHTANHQIVKKKTCKRSKNNKIAIFNQVPDVLICEVLVRVASTSIVDFTSLKSTCKEFRNIGEESYIYKHATINKYPIDNWIWRPQRKGFESFMDRCVESGNSEALYRKGLIDYFKGENVDLAFECLKKAAKSGHVEALYVVSVILIFLGQESKEKGIEILSEMLKIQNVKEKISEYRKNLRRLIFSDLTEGKISMFLQERPKCCTMDDHNINKSYLRGWKLTEKDEKNYRKCEGCSCDKEVARLCN